MEWEKVKFSGTKGEPKLSLRNNMQIGINSTFVEKYCVKEYDAVEVLVEKTKKHLGIRLLKQFDAKTSTKIHKNEKNFYFAVKQLKHLYGITPEKYAFGKVEYNEAENLFVVEVKEKLTQ